MTTRAYTLFEPANGSTIHDFSVAYRRPRGHFCVLRFFECRDVSYWRRCWAKLRQLNYLVFCHLRLVRLPASFAFYLREFPNGGTPNAIFSGYERKLARRLSNNVALARSFFAADSGCRTHVYLDASNHKLFS